MSQNSVKLLGEYRIGDFANDAAATAYVADFYALMQKEITAANFTPAERRSMEDPVLYYGRYLNGVTRPYFEQTVIPVIGSAILWFQQQRAKCVLDLGCGLAMQSIILAALGKSILAVDLRPGSIELAKKRKRYYEDLLARELPIEFVCGDFLDVDLSRFEGQIGGVFSMSAFSYIQPIENTVSLISRLCGDDARVFLFEENSANIVARTIRQRPVPEPSIVAEQFKSQNFALHSLKGTCALPKQLWVYPAANGLVRSVDQVLRKSMRLAFSYALLMERRDKTHSAPTEEF